MKIAETNMLQRIGGVPKRFSGQSVVEVLDMVESGGAWGRDIGTVYLLIESRLRCVRVTRYLIIMIIIIATAGAGLGRGRGGRTGALPSARVPCHVPVPVVECRQPWPSCPRRVLRCSSLACLCQLSAIGIGTVHN